MTTRAHLREVWRPANRHLQCKTMAAARHVRATRATLDRAVEHASLTSHKQVPYPVGGNR